MKSRKSDDDWGEVREAYPSTFADLLTIRKCLEKTIWQFPVHNDKSSLIFLYILNSIFFSLFFSFSICCLLQSNSLRLQEHACGCLIVSTLHISCWWTTKLRGGWMNERVKSLGESRDIARFVLCWIAHEDNSDLGMSDIDESYSNLVALRKLLGFFFPHLFLAKKIALLKITLLIAVSRSWWWIQNSRKKNSNAGVSSFISQLRKIFLTHWGNSHGVWCSRSEKVQF